MGGAVSSGRDNNELIDNLLGSNYIRSRDVELAFRALDRADYMLPADRDRAYKDLAWRSGALHLSAPCIYSEVMEGLELRPGLSFLNVGSGTGYLSTLAGLLLGPSGISHGVEVHPAVLDYANKKLRHFMDYSLTLDEFDFCEPKFYLGNGLSLAPLQAPYDRVYCGAGCPEEYQNYFEQLIKVGGVLVMPLNDSLLQVRRVAAHEWRSRSLLSVSFAALRPPPAAPPPAAPPPLAPPLLEAQAPARLQQLARAAIRAALRAALLARHPQLRAPPRAPPPPPAARKPCPRRICIPIDDDSDVEGLNALHDLDRETGANEMNALLSLVLSMGQNRVAGALRFDPVDSSSGDDGDDRGPRDEDDDDDGAVGSGGMDDDGGGDGDGGGVGDGGGDGAGGAEVARFDNLEDMNRAIHRAISAAEPRDPPRGRLSLTLEYSAPSAPRAHSAPPDTDFVSEPGSSPSRDGETRRDRKRHSRGSGDECRCEKPDPASAVEKRLRERPDCAGPSTSGLERAIEGAAERGNGDDDRFSADECAALAGRARRRGRGRGKRQKVDSGLGEDCPPSSDSSPTLAPPTAAARSRSCSRSRSRSRSRSSTPELDYTDLTAGRRRVPKRSRRSPSSGGRSGSSEGPGGAAARRRQRRRKRRAGDAAAARRARLSQQLQRSVRALPLPPALQLYVNLGRAFT